MVGENSFDVAVIGAGIAGASVAFELARTVRVVLIEQEDMPGYHTTGRSAALFSETYGPPVIRALSRASRSFLSAPPPDFAENRFLTPRGVIMLARADQIEALDALKNQADNTAAFDELDDQAIRRRFPLVREGYAQAAIYERDAMDIDVHALHQGFLRGFKLLGGTLRVRAEASSLQRQAGVWTIQTASGRLEAECIVNAAGAWADHVGQLAGARAIGLVPKRRTAAMVDAPATIDPEGWPMIVDVAEEFFVKPETGRLMISPADETPSVPCDAQPEELDIAIAADRVEKALDITIRRIDRKWAGLRSFVRDKCPVAGFDDQASRFFWLAGQGGYGIQTSPALARTAAGLLLDDTIPEDIAAQGVSAAALSPLRSTIHREIACPDAAI
jgi:D-arginine dehydrogenase